ncbi:MAG: ABC transporter substrate-binding protein [Pseudomonadota bacterium]
MRTRFEFTKSLVAACLFLLVVCSDGLAKDEIAIKFGVLPALQSLPLFVAESKGFFAKHGLDVELILFNTTAEKDIALVSGSLQGCCADLVTPLILKGNGRDIVVVAKTYDTRLDRRMFAILSKPGSKARSLKELEGKPVAISSNSVVDLVNQKLHVDADISEEAINTIESKNIGLRFQALVTGQVEAAVLPEPLVTVAISKGSALLADDSGLGESQTVLVFKRDFMDGHKDLTRRFLVAVEEANNLINENPDSVRDIMVEKVRLPESLKSKYPVPKFPRLAPPDRDAVNSVLSWLKEKKVIRAEIKYEQAVDDKLLP